MSTATMQHLLEVITDRPAEQGATAHRMAVQPWETTSEPNQHGVTTTTKHHHLGAACQPLQIVGGLPVTPAGGWRFYSAGWALSKGAGVCTSCFPGGAW